MNKQNVNKNKKKKKEKIFEKLGNSPINYFSDLFIAFMVILWIFGIAIMSIMATYMTVVYQDTSIWTYVTELIVAPVTAGGAIWMIKNGVQHAIANGSGKKCDYDFPKVNPPDDSLEREVSEAEQLSNPEMMTENENCYDI